MNAQTKSAIEAINGSVVNDSVVYYDDNMSLYYQAPIEDVAELVELIEDPETESDAYSHWCAGNSPPIYGVRLWVSNQPEAMTDNTHDYLRAAGVEHQNDNGLCYISTGDIGEDTKQALAAAKAVALAGHGEPELDEKYAAPSLALYLPGDKEIEQ